MEHQQSKTADRWRRNHETHENDTKTIDAPISTQEICVKQTTRHNIASKGAATFRIQRKGHEPPPVPASRQRLYAHTCFRSLDSALPEPLKPPGRRGAPNNPRTRRSKTQKSRTNNENTAHKSTSSFFQTISSRTRAKQGARRRASAAAAGGETRNRRIEQVKWLILF